MRLLLATLLGAAAGVWAYQWWLDDDLDDLERALGRAALAERACVLLVFGRDEEAPDA